MNDLEIHKRIHKLLWDYTNVKIPAWPGNKIDWQCLDNFRDKPLAKSPASVHKARGIERDFNMTIPEIAAKFNVHPTTIDRIIRKSLDRLVEKLAECGADKEDMLYLGDKTNFFNPNLNGALWRLIQSSSQM